MEISIVITIVVFLAAIFGLKSPWLGGMISFITFPLLFYFIISDKIIHAIIVSLIGFLGGLAIGYASSIIFSGLKGQGHNQGPSYVSGFGGSGAHRGGIILSDEEREGLKK